MLYFIPAWYKDGEWCENEQSWRVKRLHSEFDDTVKQIQLFHRSGTCDYRILLLGYSPNLRHFLHRQGVYRAPYWSCFDAIQGVRRKKARVLSFHDLNWPEGIEFLYTPFVVVAMLGTEKYAQIDFGEDGNPIWIELYQNGRICRRNIYDDRGFVSCTILYKEGTPHYQDYLMENGVWKLRYYYEDGHVEINERCPEYLLEYEGRRQTRHFLRRTYPCMEQVIYEVLTSWLESTDSSDIFCAAMHGLHAELLGKALRCRKMILSFFRDRYDPKEDPEILKMIRMADYVVADTRENAEKIRRRAQIWREHLMTIPLYDTRVDEGISLQLGIQKILVPVDGLGEELFGKLIRILGAYIPKKKDARVCLFTRDAGYNRKKELLEQARAELEKGGMAGAYVMETEAGMVSENGLEEGEEVPTCFFAEQCIDELSVSRCMREQWLLLDLRGVPEQYLQINAVSFGIPQIVRTRTDFIEHEGNGIVLKRIEELPQALDYYLDELKHWNKARVFSYKISRRYTTERLLEMWGEVMDCVEGDTYTADR